MLAPVTEETTLYDLTYLDIRLRRRLYYSYNKKDSFLQQTNLMHRKTLFTPVYNGSTLLIDSTSCFGYVIFPSLPGLPKYNNNKHGRDSLTRPLANVMITIQSDDTLSEANKRLASVCDWLLLESRTVA